MQWHSWRTLWAALAATVLIGVGCAPAVPPAAPQPKPDQPQSGGTVTIPIAADPTMNPWHPNAFVESIFVNRVLFDSLTRPGKDLNPAPDLALSWEAAADGLSWTFKLRDDAKWSDGQAVTADDVVFTFNDIVLKKELGATGAGNFAAVKNVEAVNPTTVKFNLARPFSALPAYLAYNAGHPARDTPFRVRPTRGRSTPSTRARPFRADPSRWSRTHPARASCWPATTPTSVASPYLDKLVFKVVPDANTQIAQALSGELSIMIMDNKAAVDRVKSAAQVRVEPRQLVQYYWLALNQTDPRFQDVRVRQAFDYAIDRQAIITAVEKGYGKPANTAIVPALQGLLRSVARGAIRVQPRQGQAAAERCRLDAGPGRHPPEGRPAVPVHHGRRPARRPAADQRADPAKPEGGRHPGGPELDGVERVHPESRRQSGLLGDRQLVGVSERSGRVLRTSTRSAAGKGFNIPGFKDPKLDDLLDQGPDRDRPRQAQAGRDRPADVHGGQPAVHVPVVPAGDRRHQRQLSRACRTSTCATTCTTCRSGG